MRSSALALFVLVAMVVAMPACDHKRPQEYGEGTRVITLAGEGATFPKALYDTWSATYSVVDPKTVVTYTGNGSGAGVEAILARKVAFGASDPPMDPGKDPRGQIVQLPMTLGGVVLGYRLSDYKIDGKPATLRLNSDLVASIFLGNVTRWNDGAVAAQNPDARGTLPNLPIRVVYRSGDSGTTSVFSDYLAQTSSHWSIGKTSHLSLAAGQAVAKNEDVAAAVGSTEGAIGYLDFAYAVGRLRMAAMQNQARQFVVPTLETIAAACAAARRSSLTDSLLNPPGQDSYPIVSFSYVLVYRDTDDRETGVALARFLWWAAHDGQRHAPAKGYVTLPAEVVIRLESKLLDLRAAGAPALIGSEG